MAAMMTADSPLFRAKLAAFEERARRLRSSLKQLIKATDAAAQHLVQSESHQSTINDILIELSSRTTIADSHANALQGVYDLTLKRTRERERVQRDREIRGLQELSERVQGAVERIKSWEERGKTFESASKTYYNELDKYLATTSTSKSESLDPKQSERAQSFAKARTSYMTCLESIVNTEETALKVWLEEWGRGRGEDDDDCDFVISNSTDDDNLSRSRSKTPTLIMPEREEERGKRDRLKGLFKSAQNHLNLIPFPTSSASLPAPSASISSQPLILSPVATSSYHDPVSLEVPTIDPARRSSPARKREGFLWATKGPPTSHATQGDGGGSWHKFWTVLSNGQLTEYSNWKTNLAVHNVIDLRFASVRKSSSTPQQQQTDRRFCFEVLTRQDRRIYQATSAEEALEWEAGIAKSIEALLIGNSSVRIFDESKITGGNGGLLSLKAFGSASTPSLVPTPLFLGSNNSSSNSGHDSVDSPAASVTSGGAFAALSNRILGRRVSAGAKRFIGRTPHSPVNDSTPSFNHNLLVPSSSSPSAASSSTGFPKDSHHPRSASYSSINTISSSPSSTLSDADRRIANEVNDFAEPFAELQVVDSKVTNTLKNCSEIAELARAAGTCCECGALEPEWSSYSLGIFLCIRCSGLHRSLGTHISKVRSVTLDDWSDEQMVKMREIGNVKSNEYFEARRPAGIIVDDSTIGSFVRQKYVEQIWIPLPPSTASDIVTSSTSPPPSPSQPPTKVRPFSMPIIVESLLPPPPISHPARLSSRSPRTSMSAALAHPFDLLKSGFFSSSSSSSSSAGSTSP